jgi:hypothetical protein
MGGLAQAADTTCSVGEPILKPLTIELDQPYQFCIDMGNSQLACTQGNLFEYRAENIQVTKLTGNCGLKSSEFNIRDGKFVGAMRLCNNDTESGAFIANNTDADCFPRKSKDGKYNVTVCTQGMGLITVVFRANDKEQKKGWLLSSAAGDTRVTTVNELSCGKERQHFTVKPRPAPHVPTRQELLPKIDVNFQPDVTQPSLDCSVGEPSAEALNLRLMKPLDMCASTATSSASAKDRKTCKPIVAINYSQVASMPSTVQENCGFRGSELSLRDGQVNGLLQLCHGGQSIAQVLAHYECQANETKDHKYDLVVCNLPGHKDTLTFAFSDNLHTQGYLLATSGANGHVLSSNRISCGADRDISAQPGGFSF